jgi:hypothetical protein
MPDVSNRQVSRALVVRLGCADTPHRSHWTLVWCGLANGDTIDTACGLGIPSVGKLLGWNTGSSEMDGRRFGSVN